MKTSYQSSPYHKKGYASLLLTLSLALTLMAFAMTAFRETRVAHRTQSTNQVRLDYNQKERAFLRSLLQIVPNAAMRCMMDNSVSNAAELSWESIFQQAIDQASLDNALDPSSLGDLGISVTALSANTGDAVYTPSGLITAPDGSGNFLIPSTTTTTLPNGLILPDRLTWDGPGSSRDLLYPIVSFNKTLPGTSGQYAEIPYPKINFGYTEQGSDFIAKRNWWAFTVTFGAGNAATTGITPSPRTYVLSIYEVPSQLAVSSAGFTTSLGKFGNGANTNWDPARISIQGSIHGERVIIEDATNLTSVSSRDGITMGSTAPASQTIGGLSERRKFEATAADRTSNTFFPYSSSADSGMVSFTPINRGLDFFDRFSDSEEANTIAPTVWSEYSSGAHQCRLSFDVCELVNRSGSGSLSNASRLIVAPTFDATAANPDGTLRPMRCSRGGAWKTPGQDEFRGGMPWAAAPSGDEWPVQANDAAPHNLPDGRRYLTLDLEKIPAFLAKIGADDTSVNNSIWVGPRYQHSGDLRDRDPSNPFNNSNIAAPNFPSTSADFALIITKSSDLSGFPNGLTIVTPWRVYFADNFNTVQTAPPAGSGITGAWYPPVSVYAPEKRFGITNTSADIAIIGGVGSLPSDSSTTSTVYPLDLKDGGTDSVNPATIRADLSAIERVEDVAPVNSMSWLTVIEEVRQ